MLPLCYNAVRKSDTDPENLSITKRNHCSKCIIDIRNYPKTTDPFLAWHWEYINQALFNVFPYSKR